MTATHPAACRRAGATGRRGPAAATAARRPGLSGRRAHPRTPHGPTEGERTDG